MFLGRHLMTVFSELTVPLYHPSYRMRLAHGAVTLIQYP